MRSGFAPRGGFTLMKTTNYLQQAARRRIAVICAVLALATASGVIGSLTAPVGQDTGRAATGPFRYFPHH